MKKQYSYKEIYSDNYEVTTYIDGVKEDSCIVETYELSGYTKCLKYNGYEFCYDREDISKCMEEISKRVKELEYCKELLESMKENPLVGCENMFTNDV